MNNFKDFLEAYSLLKIYKIVLEYTLKCSQLILSSDNKKILLTTRNVRLDSGCYATKYYVQILSKFYPNFTYIDFLENSSRLDFIKSQIFIFVILLCTSWRYSFCCIVAWIQPDISGCQQDFLIVWRWKSVENILEYIREQFYNCSRKYTKIFKTDSFLGNKKLSTNQNATMQRNVLLHFWVMFLY